MSVRFRCDSFGLVYYSCRRLFFSFLQKASRSLETCHQKLIGDKLSETDKGFLGDKLSETDKYAQDAKLQSSTILEEILRRVLKKMIGDACCCDGCVQEFVS